MIQGLWRSVLVQFQKLLEKEGRMLLWQERCFPAQTASFLLTSVAALDGPEDGALNLHLLQAPAQRCPMQTMPAASVILHFLVATD